MRLQHQHIQDSKRGVMIKNKNKKDGFGFGARQKQRCGWPRAGGLELRLAAKSWLRRGKSDWYVVGGFGDVGREDRGGGRGEGEEDWQFDFFFFHDTTPDRNLDLVRVLVLVLVVVEDLNTAYIHLDRQRSSYLVGGIPLNYIHILGLLRGWWLVRDKYSL